MWRAVRLTVVPESAQVGLGDQVILVLTVENVSSRVERYRIEVDGIPQDWYDLDQSHVLVCPTASEQVQLIVHPVTGAAITAGSYALTVQLTSEHDPTIQAAATVELMVGASTGLDMDVQPAEVEGPEAMFRIRFLNQSSAQVSVILVARDDQDALHVRLEPDGPVVVPAGTIASPVTAHVAPKVREMTGPPQSYEIAFRALLLGAATRINPYLVGQARFTYVPRSARPCLPGWWRRWPAQAAFVLLLLLAVIAGSRTLIPQGKTQAPTPRPTTTPRPRLSLPRMAYWATTGPGGLETWSGPSEWRHTADGTLYNDGSKKDSLILAPYDPGKRKIVNYEVQADMKAIPAHCPLGFGIVVRWKNNKGLYSSADCHGGPVELWAGPLQGATRIAKRRFKMNTDWLTYRLRVRGTSIFYSVSDGDRILVSMQTTYNGLHGNQGGQIGLWTHNDRFSVRDFKVRALP